MIGANGKFIKKTGLCGLYCGGWQFQGWVVAPNDKDLELLVGTGGKAKG